MQAKQQRRADLSFQTNQRDNNYGHSYLNLLRFNGSRATHGTSTVQGRVQVLWLQDKIREMEGCVLRGYKILPIPSDCNHCNVRSIEKLAKYFISKGENRSWKMAWEQTLKES